MARRTRPLLLLLLALSSGGVAALMALRYLRQQTPLMAVEPPSAKVVVATRTLALGAIVGERDVKLVNWAGAVVPGGFYATPEEVIGRGLLVPLQENEPVLAGKLAPKGAGGGLPVIIEEGMRAFSVAVDQVIGVSGFVTPSTRVDVLLTLIGTPNLREPATKLIMQNVRTLAAGHSIQQDKDGKPQEVPVVTLLVTPEQAETLALAASQGRIQLALRNTMDTANVQTSGTRVSALMSPPSGRSPRRAAAVRASVPEPNSTTVEVYRGGARTLMKFEQ
ncbi:MAG: Flp pilus assembly protein CpaB [Gemmatimonadales bacterium]